MAGFVPNEFAASVLEVIAGKTTVTATSLYLGLARELNTTSAGPEATTLSNIVEVTTGGYARKVVPAFDSASTVAPIQILVSTTFYFNALTEDMVDPAPYAFLTTAASGTSGKIRYIWELPAPIQGRNGESLKIPAGNLIIE